MVVAIMDCEATVTKNGAIWLLQLWTTIQLLQKKWRMLVIGDALSPLKFSKNKAKF